MRPRTGIEHLAAFARSPLQVGAVAPSSQYLARAVADQIDFGRARTVVELGPGTGSITSELLKRLAPYSRLIAVELDPRFASGLRERFPDQRLLVITGSAVELDALLAERGFDGCDAVASAIPFANLPDEVRQDILRAVRQVLRGGGVFAAVQYLPFVLLPRLRARFARAGVGAWCLRNIPPAFVLVASQEQLPRFRAGWWEARHVLAGLGILTLGAFRWKRPLGLLAAMLTAAAATMFRDPPRVVPAAIAPGAVLAPADGTVLTVGPGSRLDGSECLEMRLFLALSDVHVQRAPAVGVVTSVVRAAGRFGPAFVAAAGDRNTRVTIRVQASTWAYELVQVSGMLARRIVTWVEPGDRLQAGERIGMIKLGSQVILRLPVESRALVEAGQHVRAGLDVVALVPSGIPD